MYFEYKGTPAFHLFNLRHPPGFVKCIFLRFGKLFSSARGSFFALSTAGHGGGPRVDCGASLDRGRVLWSSGRSQSCVLTVFGETAFRDAKPRRNVETPRFQLFRVSAVHIAPFLQLSSCLLCGSHGTTAAAPLPFVTATDGASVCACVCHVPCCPRKKKRAHNPWCISREVQGRCAAGRYKTELPRNC